MSRRQRGSPQPAQLLVGVQADDIEVLARNVDFRGVPPPPGPLEDTNAKLVNDFFHPWEPLREEDIRGPCPGLNTLASHGYFPRNGIATPAQIIEAAQEGFNMGNDLAVLITYAGMLVDGNVVTNLLSIGSKTPETGPDPPSPAVVGGLDTHLLFEGDASLTRGDAFFGDNHSFNETLFEQLVSVSNQFGGGSYNLAAATELRFLRIEQSIATNPQFFFEFPRIATAYVEAVFPFQFFVDGRSATQDLNLDVARGFFQISRMPPDFFRRNGSFDLNSAGSGVIEIFSAHPVLPGVNMGVGNFVPDSNPLGDATSIICAIYDSFITRVQSLYPNPTGVLKDALNGNLANFFSPIADSGCTEFSFT